MRLGVVDVGSNTVHLSVIEGRRGTPPLPAYSVRRRLHLAEGIDGDGAIPDDAAGRLVEALGEAAATCEQHAVDELLVFATAVVRDATNRDDVVARVASEAGVRLQVLTGEDEARFTYSAARRWFGWSSGPMVVLDIGGGSFEIAAGRDELPAVALSVPLGAGRLAREWLPRTKASRHDIRALRAHARDQIRDAVTRLRWEGGSPFCVGTSKTFTQLALLAGAPSLREGPFAQRSLKLRDVQQWEGRLARMHPSERAQLRGISKRRAHQIVAGAVVARTTMRALNLDRLSICPWALREGIILSRLDATEPDLAARDNARLVLAASQSTA